MGKGMEFECGIELVPDFNMTHKINVLRYCLIWPQKKRKVVYNVKLLIISKINELNHLNQYSNSHLTCVHKLTLPLNK